MNNRLLRPHHNEAIMLPAIDTAFSKKVNGSQNGSALTSSRLSKPRKQRVTITLPLTLLERLRNAVYWTGHGPLAQLISDALDEAVTHMGRANGQAFPQRLAPLKRGRPRTKTPPAALPIATAAIERLQ